MRRKFPGTRKLLLFAGDIILVLLGFYMAYWIYDYINHPLIAFEQYYLLLFFVVLATGGLLTLNGLLSLVKMSAYQVLVSTAVAVVQLAFFTMAASFIIRDISHSRTVVFSAAFFQGALLIAWNYGFWRMERSMLRNKDVAFIGPRIDYNHVLERMGAVPYSNYQLRFAGDSIEACKQVFSTGLPDVIMLSAKVDTDAKDFVLHKTYQTNIPMVMVPEYYEVCCFNMELDKIDDIPVFRARPMRLSLEQRILKKAFDLAIAFFALVLLLPLLAIVVLLIKLVDNGPVLFKQERVGRDGELFFVYKFRSMVSDAEARSGPVLACAQDPRITRVGKFLRVTRLDELPQLFNVLMGDMSLVGPRPERPFFVEQYAKEMPHYGFRHHVKPGITGLAQVFGKYNTTAEDKLVFDLIYIQKWSILMDLIIILQTCKVVFLKSQAEGAKMVDDSEEKNNVCQSTNV